MSNPEPQPTAVEPPPQAEPRTKVTAPDDAFWAEVELLLEVMSRRAVHPDAERRVQS